MEVINRVSNMNDIIGLADGGHDTAVDVNAKIGELGADELLVVIKFIKLELIPPCSKPVSSKEGPIITPSHWYTVALLASLLLINSRAEP